MISEKITHFVGTSKPEVFALFFKKKNIRSQLLWKKIKQEGVQTGEKSYHFAWVHEPEPTDRIWQEKPEKQGRQIQHIRFYNV